MSWIRRFAQFAIDGPRRMADALFGYDFFISYAHRDGEDYAQELDRALREKYTVHLDTRDYHVGQDLRVLTRLRVRNSRLLVVVGRPSALTESYWVRREVEMFHNTRREPVVIDVDGAVEAALAAPPKGSLAAWLADNREIREDGTPVYPMLLEIDAAEPTSGRRVPQLQVVHRLQARFSGDRVETRRLRIVTGALVILILTTAAAVWQAGVAEARRTAALMSLAQANSNELAARARVTSLDRLDLALALATRSVAIARANTVSWTEGASALRDIMNQTRGARQYCLQQGEGRSIDFSEPIGLLAVAKDTGVVCLFRRDEDGTLRIVDTLQSFSGGAVDEVRFSEDGEWLITQLHGGPLRALPVGDIYKNKSSMQQGEANYRFETFGDTDQAKALSFDGTRTRVAFFSRASSKIQVWSLLKSGPTTAPLTSLDPAGHVLATAFDPTGNHLAALVLETNRKQEEQNAYDFWEPSEHDLLGPPKFRVKIWSLSTLAISGEFGVLDGRNGVYLGDGINMGGLRGLLRVGPEARWIAPALFLADAHSLEPRMIAQVIHVPDLQVTASFMNGEADKSFDGWEEVSEIGFTNDGQAFFALNNSVIRFWSLQVGRGDTRPRRLRELITPSARSGALKAQGVVSAVSLSANDRLLATLDSTDSLTVWDVSTGVTASPTAPLMFVEGVEEASRGAPSALRFSQNGGTVFFAAANGEVRGCDIRNRCGPIAPRHVSAPSHGGRWKELYNGKWIAAVSEQQIVSFFRPDDLSAPFLDVSASDEPAPVVSRGYAMLSGTPGRPVAVVSSADGAWAAVFERQQYGFNKSLRLVRLTGQAAVFDVSLASTDCDGSFLTVQFDSFQPYIVVLSKFGCIAFAKLPETGADPIVTKRLVPSHSSGLGVPSLTFTRNYVLVADKEQGQLWARDGQTGAASRLLLDRSDGTLLLPINEKQVIFVGNDQGGVAQSLISYPLTAKGIGQPVAIGNYSSVKRIALGREEAVIIGSRTGASQETVAVWSLATFALPVIEHPLTFRASDPTIVFDSTSKVILIGPTSYSLKDKRPSPQNETAMLLNVSAVSPSYRPVKIDIGDGEEDCEEGDSQSCFEFDYLFSPDGAWLAVSRTQSFGPPGPASVWSVGATLIPRLTFPSGSEVDFDPTSHWLMVSSAHEQRLWRLQEHADNWLDQGRIASAGTSWFVQGNRALLTLTTGEIALQPLDIDDLIVRVSDFVGRNLSPSEWAALFGKLDYEESFPVIPPNVERVSDLVNRGKALASSGKREEASKLFMLAAQLAAKTGSVEIDKTVIKAALDARLVSSATAALEYAVRILPQDQEVQELRKRATESVSAGRLD